MERPKKLLIIQEGTILSSKNKKTYSEKNSCISRKFLYFRRKHAKPGNHLYFFPLLVFVESET